MADYLLRRQGGALVKAHVVRPQELDSSQRASWLALTASNPLYRNPFYSPHFALAVAEARNDAMVAVLEDNGATVGFFPFHRLRGGVAKPIGGPISDYHGPILDAHIALYPQELLRLCGLASYDFNHLPVAMEAFSADAYDHTLSRHIDLSKGFDAYAEERPKIWKKTIREMARRTRKAEREIGAVEFTYHDPSNKSYETHVAHKNEMFNRLKVQSILNVGWVQTTLDIIRHTQLPEFAGVMTTVRADGRLMGAHFGIRSQTDWHWWFPSYDQELSKYGPGIMLLHGAATRAEELGIKWIDFGRGDSEYKITFSNGATPLCEGSIERNVTRPGMLRMAQKATLRALRPIPLGRMESYPRRAFGRLISGMRLPSSSA